MVMRKISVSVRKTRFISDFKTPLPFSGWPIRQRTAVAKKTRKESRFFTGWGALTGVGLAELRLFWRTRALHRALRRMAGLGFHIQLLAGACHRHGVGGFCGVF